MALPAIGSNAHMTGPATTTINREAQITTHRVSVISSLRRMPVLHYICIVYSAILMLLMSYLFLIISGISLIETTIIFQLPLPN